MGWITEEGEIENSYKISKIAAHVPDLVYSTLTNDISYVENFLGVLLFADVSGFTNLTEKFSLSSKKGYGADEFTRTLNSYIGETVSRKLAVVSLSDAILALWTVERVQLSEVISLVVKCSISAGKLSKVIVGGEISQYFVVIGRAVDEVRLAEGLAVASTIILSPNAWELCEIEWMDRWIHFSVEKYQDSIGTSVEHEIVTRGTVKRLARYQPVIFLLTCYYSKLPLFYFNELPKKAMKVVKNTGVLYQFMANKHQMYDHLM
uniref:Guanylate cyclase domain-containing protein n=1 Tax=Oncorhynchus tshawytscha TaxID=74940 RepID=A0A8C8ET58_ONCTS